MTTLQRDILGYNYDVSKRPAFLVVSDYMLFHFVTHRLFSIEGLTDLANRTGRSPKHGEVGKDDTLAARYGYNTANITPIGGLNPSTTATAGTPGSFDADVPLSLHALNIMGPLGNTAAWSTGEYIVLDDGSEAYSDGSQWQAGRTPAPLAQVDVSSTGGGTDTLTVTFTGGPSDAFVDILTTGLLVGAGTTIPTPDVVSISQGDTVDTVATAYAAYIGGLSHGGVDIDAVAAGGVVTITNSATAPDNEFFAGFDVVIG